jgi:hypothetical protein
MDNIRIRCCEKCNSPGRCSQIIYPLTKEEEEILKPDGKKPTVETLRLFMQATIKPECLEKMLKRHPVEWWFDR